MLSCGYNFNDCSTARAGPAPSRPSGGTLLERSPKTGYGLFSLYCIMQCKLINLSVLLTCLRDEVNTNLSFI